jgi:hypothetical protein
VRKSVGAARLALHSRRVASSSPLRRHVVGEPDPDLLGGSVHGRKNPWTGRSAGDRNAAVVWFSTRAGPSNGPGSSRSCCRASWPSRSCLGRGRHLMPPGVGARLQPHADPRLRPTEVEALFELPHGNSRVRLDVNDQAGGLLKSHRYRLNPSSTWLHASATHRQRDRSRMKQLVATGRLTSPPRPRHSRVPQTLHRARAPINPNPGTQTAAPGHPSPTAAAPAQRHPVQARTDHRAPNGNSRSSATAAEKQLVNGVMTGNRQHQTF